MGGRREWGLSEWYFLSQVFISVSVSVVQTPVALLASYLPSNPSLLQFSSVQLLSRVRLFATP